MPAPDAFHAMLEPADQAKAEEPPNSWAERPVPRRTVMVKCPRCGTVNTADDPRCVGCLAPLGYNPAARPAAAPGRRAARWGLVALAVGAGLGPILGDGITLVARTRGGPNVNLLLLACLGSGIGAVVGYVLGFATTRQK
jgi:hypothetical protein